MEGILGRAMAVVLGLIALAAVALAATGAFSSSKASTVVSDITMVVANARGLFSQNNNGYTNFTSANESALSSAGVFPSDMVRSSAIYDAWGNSVTLSSADSDTEGVVAFGGGGSETVKQCVTVVTGLKDYVSLEVGGTTFTETNQPDATTAESACESDLTITLTFQ
ncbi:MULTISPECIES: type 4 pilus major pilin [unclassified Paraburkholderia]|uniref:type 4 pilus major pilin n=1 Tax=unclassified Paraburkholderia TaxID=2615204 RepID=UPI002AB0FD89|nr:MULTISPECIES: type 4 pilus major pilin [unclassified Paraburkholderia]